MQKRISILLIFISLVTPVVAQDNARRKPQGGAETGEAAQRNAEESQRKTQAIDILKSVVEGAAEIQDVRTRVTVLTSALDLLWQHDEVYARANFIKHVGVLSDRFASDATQRQERSQIREAMGTLLPAFARHDPQLASRLLEKFQRLIEEVSKGNSLSLSERLSLAQAGLESDTEQSTALAARVLDMGVPGSFPSYLNELEQRDAAAAASLFRTALSILTSGRVYTPVHVTVLSAYVFRESQMSVPMPTGGRDGVPLQFGTFASPLSPASRTMDRALVAAYLTASAIYLTRELIGLEQRAEPDAVQVGLDFFLVKKLRGYADKLVIDGGQDWIMLDAKYSMIAERAKLNDNALSGLATVAQRIVAENTVFRFDGGESALASAEKARDPAERTELLATGIRQQIDDGKYAQAVQKIAEIQDDKFREQLNTYLSFRMAEAALKKLDWFSFNSQVNRVTDARLRTYLILSAALAASDAKQKKTSSDLLLTAMTSFQKIEDVDARAAALVTTAGILYTTAEPSWGAQVLTEGVNAINHAARYDGSVYHVTLEMAKSRVLLPLPKFDLSHSFEQAAKRDWLGALAAAQGIESKALRSQAYIAACRNVL